MDHKDIKLSDLILVWRFLDVKRKAIYDMKTSENHNHVQSTIMSQMYCV